MASYSQSKINFLVTSSKRGSVLTACHLRKLGFSYELLRSYEKSGWLDSLGYGAYKVRGDEVDWTGALWTLQTQMGIAVHIGGKTALELQGYGHFAKHALLDLHLFGEKGETLPSWFRKRDWGCLLKFCSPKLFPSNVEGSLSVFESNGLQVTISGPERAAMEMLSFVPGEQSFSEAFLIMENLSTLRPSLVQSLLENCNSIKVKRLFLCAAEKHKYRWFDRLDIERVQVGTGKRVIVKDGALDKKYLITIPKEQAGE